MTLWVVKIGTSLLRGETAATIEGYARCFAAAMARGDQVVLVTSGAVGLGCQKLAMSSRPDTVVALQAAAAIGQGALMALYERAMARHGCSVAQVLLTRSDLVDRRRYQNASGTLRQLLSWGVLPVINENDALSTAELRFGDNDTLSALVAAAAFGLKFGMHIHAGLVYALVLCAPLVPLFDRRLPGRRYAWPGARTGAALQGVLHDRTNPPAPDPAVGTDPGHGWARV